MPRTSRMSTTALVTKSVGLFAWLVLVLNVSVTWLASAQQTTTPPSAAAAPPSGVPVEAANFTGKTAALDASNISGGRRLFEAGSRSYWHAHPNGQLILNESGIGLHQVQGKPMTRLAPGDSVYVGPGVVHWHGAAPDSSLTQVNIGFGGMTKWGEPVADAVYRGKAR
jgi:quercetin dioxygenase-like cupin family protein